MSILDPSHYIFPTNCSPVKVGWLSLKSVLGWYCVGRDMITGLASIYITAVRTGLAPVQPDTNN